MSKMVSFIHHFGHKEWIFDEFPPTSRSLIFEAPHWTKRFTDFVKKWIIQQFGRTPGPASTRRTFLKPFHIRGRGTKGYIISLINLKEFGIIFKNLDQSKNRNDQKRIQRELKKRWKM